MATSVSFPDSISLRWSLKSMYIHIGVSKTVMVEVESHFTPS